MVVFRGLGSYVGKPERAGSSDEEICEIIITKVVVEIRGAITEMFGSVKTMLIEEFDMRDATVLQAIVSVATASVAVAGLREVGQNSA